MINIDDLIKEKVAINCKSFEETEILIEIFSNHALMILRNANFYWSRYRDKICFDIETGMIEYCNYGYYEEHEWLIISFEEFMGGYNYDEH